MDGGLPVYAHRRQCSEQGHAHGRHPPLQRGLRHRQRPGAHEGQQQLQQQQQHCISKRDRESTTELCDVNAASKGTRTGGTRRFIAVSVNGNGQVRMKASSCSSSSSGSSSTASLRQ